MSYDLLRIGEVFVNRNLVDYLSQELVYIDVYHSDLSHNFRGSVALIDTEDTVTDGGIITTKNIEIYAPPQDGFTFEPGGLVVHEGKQWEIITVEVSGSEHLMFRLTCVLKVE